jgi:CLASP N terminal
VHPNLPRNKYPGLTQFHSNHDLVADIKQFELVFHGKETEENWEARELALQHFRSIIRGQSTDLPHYNPAIRSCTEIICGAVTSLNSSFQV